MNNIVKLLCGAAMLPVCLYAQTDVDSIADAWERQFNLKEVVVTGKRPVVRQQEGKLVYMVRNDPYAKGLDGLVLLDRLPRVTVNNGAVSVAGKGSVRYIIDGILMELDATAMTMRLQNLRAENIEKIELLSTPPARYAVEPNAVYISITTRDESLGTRGSVYGSLNQADRMREYLSGSISHTTRHIGLSLDGSFSNYYSRNDNNMEFQGADTYRLSSTSNRSHMVDAGMNLLFRYKWTDRLCLGAIVNYNYGSTSTSGHNTSDYGAYTSTSSISTESRPNNALTLTGFLDWNLGTKGEKLELTYNYFTRHSPNRSDIATTLNNYASEGFVKELGKSDYRFHSGKADFKFPFPAVQVETGAAYTDIVNKSDNRMWQAENPSGLTRQGWADKFEYTERVAAAYITASRSLGQGWWAKAGLRYEYTWTEGRQPEENRLSHDGYGRLFPSVSLSWKSDRAGAFNASYSAGMGRPNLWELNPFRYYSTTAEYSAGNPSLTPTLYHNAEINYYGLGGLYAVVYTSFASDAIGYIRRFDDRGMLSTMPFNCLSTNKTGLYANYKLNLLDRWEVKGGGEVFRTWSHSDTPDYKVPEMTDWSGKLEFSTNVMLNRQKTLIFGAQFTHFFPWQQNLIHYRSFSLCSFSLRYSLMNGRMNLRLVANDLFGWNKTRSLELYDNYTMNHTFDAHPGYLLLGVSYRFGRDKVSSVWRDSKEKQSGRTK